MVIGDIEDWQEYTLSIFSIVNDEACTENNEIFIFFYLFFWKDKGTF